MRFPAHIRQDILAGRIRHTGRVPHLTAGGGNSGSSIHQHGNSSDVNRVKREYGQDAKDQRRNVNAQIKNDNRAQKKTQRREEKEKKEEKERRAQQYRNMKKDQRKK